MEECESLDSGELQEFQFDSPEAIGQDDEDEVEDLRNSLRDVVQDQSVKPKLQCLMVDPSFSMVTVQSEDSGIVWETASSRCSTPWTSETSSVSEAYSMEGSGSQGKITIVFDEENIVRRRIRAGGRISRLSDRLRRSSGSRPGSALGEERLEMAEVSIPNVKSEKTEPGPDLDEIKNKDQQLFSLISEGYEILNIRVPSKLPTVDEEESTELEDNLSYLDQTPGIRSRIRAQDHALPVTMPEALEDSLDHTEKLPVDVVMDTHAQKDTSDMDYFEKFTLLDEGASGEQAPEPQEEIEQPAAKPQTEGDVPGEEMATYRPSSSEESFVFVTDVDILEEHLDEVFYGAGVHGPPDDALQRRECEEKARLRKRRESQRSSKDSGSALFDKEETTLTPIFLPTGPPKIIDLILLEEPTAMSFMYSDLYEDALGETRKSDEEHSEARRAEPERTFKRRLSDSEEVGGYLEKFTLKVDTPAVEIKAEEEEEEEENRGQGRMLWLQSDFDLTGCLSNVAKEEKVKRELVKTEEESPATTMGNVQLPVYMKEEKEERVEPQENKTGSKPAMVTEEAFQKDKLTQDMPEVREAQEVRTDKRGTAMSSQDQSKMADNMKAQQRTNTEKTLNEDIITATRQHCQSQEAKISEVVTEDIIKPVAQTDFKDGVQASAHVDEVTQAVLDIQMAASVKEDGKVNEIIAAILEPSVEIKETDIKPLTEITKSTVVLEGESAILTEKAATFEFSSEGEPAVQAFVEVVDEVLDKEGIQTKVHIALQDVNNSPDVNTVATKEGKTLEAEKTVETENLIVILPNDIVPEEKTSHSGEKLPEVLEAIHFPKLESVTVLSETDESKLQAEGDKVKTSAGDAKPFVNEKVNVGEVLILLVPKGKAVEMDIKISETWLDKTDIVAVEPENLEDQDDHAPAENTLEHEPSPDEGPFSPYKSYTQHEDLSGLHSGDIRSEIDTLSKTQAFEIDVNTVVKGNMQMQKEELSPVVELQWEKVSPVMELHWEEVSPVLELHREEVSPVLELHREEVSPGVELHREEVSPGVELHREEVSPVMEIHKEEVSPVVELHREEVSPVVELHREEVSPVMEIHKEEMSPVVELHREEVSPVVELHREEVSPVMEIHKEEVSPVVELHREEVSPVVELHREEVSLVMEIHKEKVSPVVELHREEVSPVVELHREEISPVVEIHKEVVSPGVELQKEQVSPVVELHREEVSPVVEIHKEVVSPGVEIQKEQVSPVVELLNKVVTSLDETAEDLDFEVISKQEAREEAELERGLDLPPAEELIEADYDIIDAEEEIQARAAAELQGMDWFCETCGRLLSEDEQVSGVHQGHCVTTVDKAYDAIKEKLCDYISELQGRSENIEDLVSELELAYNSVENQCVESEDAMRRQNEEMMALVMEQYNGMSLSMEDEKKAKLGQLYDQIVCFQESIDSAKATLETTDREAETDARSPEDIETRLKIALLKTTSLELGPKGLLVFEDYAKGNASSSHLAQRQGIPVPNKPTLQPQEQGSATCTSVTVYWTVNPGDIIDCFQVYCMEHPHGAVSEEYRVTVKESYCVLEEMEPDKTYKVWVMAVNHTGCSLPSERLAFTTAPSVPVIDTERCSVLWDSATLRWSSAGPATGLTYTLEYSRQYELEGEGLRSISGIKGTEQKVPLQPNENYLFYIKAVNQAGASEQSEAALISTKRMRFQLLKNSAHSCLELSEDQTTIHYAADLYDNTLTAEEQYPFILGELLPSQGRYYWETIVTGCSAYRVGVAYETTDRNSPLGENNESWCLRRISTPSSCRFQVFHNTIQSDMLVTEMPERLGTLLDYQHGRLSFYNAQSGQLLGTLSHRFSQPCHPALGMDMPGRLELCLALEVPEFVNRS